MLRWLAPNVSAWAVAGIGGLGKRSEMLRPTSCDLSHMINLNKETESIEDTEPGHCRKHIVGGSRALLLTLFVALSFVTR